MLLCTRVLVLLAVCLVAAAGVRAHQVAGDPTPRAVAEAVERRDTGRDSRLELTMRLFDRQDRMRERTLRLSSLRGQRGRGDRILIRFLAPNDIKGTGFLVWEHEGADDERFLYLPALGRVRRIAGAEKQESFVGSDLSYEDIGGRDLDDYTYRFAPPPPGGVWKAPDGQAHAVWALESRATDPEAMYPRTVSLVRKDNFVVVAADIYNRRDEREKRYEVRRLERIEDVWTATDVVMRNELQRTRTELVVESARYNVGLSESDFTRRLLEQRLP